MHSSNCKSSKMRLLALTAATSAVLALSAQAHDSHHRHHGISQSGEQKNMERVGHVDLQGRSAYQPNVIRYPNGRTIAFVGTHGGMLPNPLNGGAIEPNGTMIIDVTNPRRPKEVYHIKNQEGGTNQMVRLCLGSDLTGNPSDDSVYLMRNFGSGYQTWDVTDVRNPQHLASFYGPPGHTLSSTHKLWWECKTGIAYLPGRPSGWEQRGIVIVDWQDPTNPVYLRTFGLPGAQPGGAGAQSPHGPISTYDAFHDPAFPGDDRIYIAYGTSSDGVLQIMNRQELLPPPYGNYTGDRDSPTDEELTRGQIARYDMSPDQGGHTSFPVFGLEPPSYQDFTEFKTRDVVVFSSESTSNQCEEAPHWSFIVDITTEELPWTLSTMWVDPRSGEKYPRGNYCTRGARFGVHSSEENFFNPYYGKLTFLAYFTGGVRVWDIREPQAPREVGFYVPVNNRNTLEQCNDSNTICKISYMTNNLEVDDRGYIYIVDRSASGMDILQLTDDARKIGSPDTYDRDDDDHHDNHHYRHRHRHHHRKHH